MNLNYYMPTRIIMTDNCVINNADVLKSLGNKALIVTGKKSAVLNGSLSDMTAALKMNNQEWLIFDKVMPNPTVDCVYEGAAFARENAVDFIIAMGGGSPMDAAKAMALLACREIPRDKLFSGNYGDSALPLICVPTTAGTGSEVTQYAILTNDDAQTKTSIATPILFPKVALLDSKYTNSLSKETTVNTAIDALSHAIESMLSKRASAISDALALSAIEIICGQFDNLKHFKFTQEDRSRLLYASALGGMVIAQTGTTAVHSMGYSLTYFKSIDHGRANGLLIAEFMKFIAQNKPDVIKAIVSKTGSRDLSGFARQLNELLGEKEKLTAAEAKKFAQIAIKAKNIPNCIVTPEENNLLDIYIKVFE